MSLSNVRGLVIDLDGCVYVGNKPIAGAGAALSKLREMGYKILFLTNNSTLTRRRYAEKLRGMGIVVDENEILTSGVIAARYINDLKKGAFVFPVAESGFTDEAEALGLKMVSDDEWKRAEFVVVGLDRELTYRKLASAAHAINAGARFVCTNLDNVYPSERGFEPGAGAIAAALEKATGIKPISVGKPSEETNKQVFAALGLKSHEVAFIGDRIDTDIRSARLAGSLGILVRTGAARLFDIGKSSEKPDYVIESLADLPRLLEKGYT